MLNPNYVAPDPTAVDAEGNPDPVARAGSDYDLPVGWTMEQICEREDCGGALLRPLEGRDWPRYCSPTCEEIVKARANTAPLPPLDNVPR